MADYDGPVGFVDGVHYPVKDDHVDLTRPLRWEDGHYRDAQDGEPLHNDVFGSGDAELEPGSE